VTASQLHMAFGWALMLLGAVSGALIGLGFHRSDWAGGYGSFRRRLMRLGHIAFFGLGILNVLFGLALPLTPQGPAHGVAASAGFIVGGVSMPLCCFLAAWQAPFRHAFVVPVAAILVGIGCVILSWAGS